MRPASNAATVVGFSMSGKYAQYLDGGPPVPGARTGAGRGSPAGEIALPDGDLDDWYRRAGDAELMIELVRGLVAGRSTRRR